MVPDFITFNAPGQLTPSKQATLHVATVKEPGAVPPPLAGTSGLHAKAKVASQKNHILLHQYKDHRKPLVIYVPDASVPDVGKPTD